MNCGTLQFIAGVAKWYTQWIQNPPTQVMRVQVSPPAPKTKTGLVPVFVFGRET